MAPFDGKLDSKLSPLIEGQVPDFVQADHPKYVQFLKSYYKFLEAAEITLTLTIDSIRMETVSSNHIVVEGSDGDRGDRINTESGTGTTGKFEIGETITGSISKATAEVLVDDLGKNKRIFISSQQKFEIGETITGGTSGSTATLDKYRANPVQNIQQLMEYANTDNTTTEFINEMFNMYMESIPRTLASGTSKRDLIKNIKDLYASKGSSEATKLFLRLMFDEQADIIYPNKFMLKASKGNWSQPTIMRLAANGGSDANDIVGQTITGVTSGATSVVLDSIVFSQGSTSVSQIEVDPDLTTGTFQTGETLTVTSNTADSIMSFVVKSFITGSTIDRSGILYKPNDALNADATIGNGRADIEVEEISSGGISGVIIDDRGQDYKIGDTLTFTPNALDTNVSVPSAIVSAVGGTILLEDTIGNDDFLTLENNTVTSLPHPFIQFEDGDRFALNGTNGASLNADFNMLMEDATPRNIVGDVYGTDNDRLIIEEATADTAGELSRIILTGVGNGFTRLPSATVTSVNGASGKVVVTTKDIGKIESVKVKDGGFDYPSSPSTKANTQFILKDVTGTFVSSNTLTTHTGTVKSYDGTTQHLEVDFENVERIKVEAESTVNENIELEQSTPTAERFYLDNTLDSDGDNISLEDGQGVLKSDAIRTMGGQITLQNVGNVNQKMELEEKRGDASLSELFGYGSVEARTRTPRGEPVPVDEFVIPDLAQRGNLFKLEGSVVGGSILINSTDGSADAGDEILLDGTDGSSSNAGSKVIQFSDDEGDNILYENEPAIPHTQQRFSKFALDGTLKQRSTPSGWLPDDGSLSGGETLYENQGGFRVSDETDGILLEDSIADATYNTKEFLILEDGDLYVFYEEKVINHQNTPDGRLMDEENGGFILEKSRPDILVDDNSFVTLDNNLNDASVNLFNIVLEGDTGFLINEDFGNNLRQEGEGLHMGDVLLHEPEDNDVNQKLIDETDGDNIISESFPDMNGVTITDTGGATGTVVDFGFANIVPTLGVESELTGFYRNTDHHISDGVIRLQDSFFYQDFSYEIRIGQSIENYMNELKKAVHPAGFAVFGRVTLASLITANIQVPTAGGVSAFTADTDTFSPALASTLENIFQIEIPRRLQATKTPLKQGDLFAKIEVETAVDSGPDANIIHEQTGEAISLEIAAGVPNEGHDLSLIKTAKVTIGLPAPNFRTKAGSHSGLPLFATVQVIANGIEMEDGTRTFTPTISRDRILLDGTLSGGGAVVEDGELLELERGTVNNADEDSGISLDDLQFRRNDTFVLEQSATFNETIELEYATEITEGRNTAPNQLILDGTDGSSTNAGDHLLHEDSTTSFGDNFIQEGDSTPLVTEDILNGEITIEEIVRSSLLSLEGRGKEDDTNDDHILSEQSMEVGDILQEIGFELLLNEDGDRFDLEDDSGKIIREFGEDGGFGQKMIVEDATTPQRGGRLTLDHQNIEMDDASDVTIPAINFRETNFPRFTRPVEISQSAHGIIALQDEREVTNIVMNGTDGSSTNAGDNILSERDSDNMVMEEAASRILEQHNPGFAQLDGTDGSGTNAGDYISFEIGTRPPFVYPLFSTGDLAATYDATTLTFDTTQQTYDATV